MYVVFLAPWFPQNQRHFVRSLAQAGARVIGVGEQPIEQYDAELKSWMTHYERIGSVTDAGQLEAIVRRLQEKVRIDRLECAQEMQMMAAATVREACGIPGLASETVRLCRDKSLMKEFMRARGVPCARSIPVSTADECRAAAEEIGYPLVLKPRDGAGTHNTFRIETPEQLDSSIEKMGLPQQPRDCQMEEFIRGHEGWYDTLTVNGEVVAEFVGHYFPNVLDAMENRWISPQMITTNRVGADSYKPLREMGRKVIRELGLSTSATHMEWFYGPKGLTFGEIGARPIGDRFWDVYCWANEFDLYGEWGRAIVHGAAMPKPSRRYSAGYISVRPTQDGHIRGISGLEECRRRCGEWMGDVMIPPVGSKTADVIAGYLAHACIWVRHPDFDECKRMLDYIGRTLRLYAS